MATLTWMGSSADWYDASQWIVSPSGSSAVPLPGDHVHIGSGVVRLVGSEARDDQTFDDQTVALGGPDPRRPAELLATSAVFQIYFDVTTPAGLYARIATIGPSGFDGSLDVKGHLTLDAERPDGGEAADFVLTSDAFLTVEPSGSLKLLGQIKLETAPGQAIVRAGGSLIEDGVLSLLGSTLGIAAGANLSGTGTLQLGAASSVSIDTAAPATLTIAFEAAGATLKIGAPADFAARIVNFMPGDRIDLENLTADFAAIDPVTGLLEVRNGGASGALLVSLKVSVPDGGALEAKPDGAGGTILDETGSPARLAENIDVGDQALRSDAVRATMTTSSGAPIDGSGVRIGIISDSFDATGTADSAAADGYLPYDAATGTAAVSVLQDDPQGSDEGQAMAELVHQIAPGAEIDFCTGGNTLQAMADAVNRLRAAGCSIITDDLGFAQEPYFQVTGRLDGAIERAIAQGVDYFTAASNLGNAFYQSTFDPILTQLMNAPSQSVAAQLFSNGTPYQTITVTGGESAAIDLQWDAPFPQDHQDVPDALVMTLYDRTGHLVATSHQLKLDGVAIPEIEIDLKPQAAPFTNYRLAIAAVPGAPTVGQFAYFLSGTGDGSGPGGFIDDPAAENGAGTTSGHDLVPGANTVGAADWSNAPAFGTSDFPEGFSSSGPGELLFDQAGNRLPAPVDDGKVDFLAPDGIDVSTPSFQPFYGTSAAAPNAAAVAALMLQANPDLTPAEVTRLMQASAVDMGLPPAEQGAGFIQADQAVAFAEALTAPTLSFDPAQVSIDASSGLAALTLSGASNAVGQNVGITLDGAANPIASAEVAADGTWTATIAASALAPSALAPSALAPGGHLVAAEVAGSGQASADARQGLVLPEVMPAADGGTIFVFEPGARDITLTSFVVSGPRHDEISLPASDAARLGAILACASTDAAGDATLHLSPHHAIILAGVSVAEIARHRGDFTFHA